MSPDLGLVGSYTTGGCGRRDIKRKRRSSFASAEENPDLGSTTPSTNDRMAETNETSAA